MSANGKRSLPPLVDHYIVNKSDWKDSTAETARTDAQRVLEALLAEFGVDAALTAMDRQGFTSTAYKTIVSDLAREATARRLSP